MQKCDFKWVPSLCKLTFTVWKISKIWRLINAAQYLVSTQAFVCHQASSAGAIRDKDLVAGWFCVNTGGQQLGFIAEIKGHSGQVQRKDLWVPLGEIAEHPATLCTSETAWELRRVLPLKACHSQGRSDTSQRWIGLCFSVIAVLIWKLELFQHWRK